MKVWEAELYSVALTSAALSSSTVEKRRIKEASLNKEGIHAVPAFSQAGTDFVFYTSIVKYSVEERAK